MRLELGELAMCLGCTPDRVLWEPGLVGDEPPIPAEDQTKSILSLKELSVTRTSGLPEEGFESAPWASIMPTGAQFDSRAVQPGNLFFCLPGEQTDGHKFGLEAAKAGACAIIAQRNPYFGRENEARHAQMGLPPVFLVEDVKRALWRSAVCHRDTSVARVLGITGSAGKTSVKEVLANVLAVRGRTERSLKNYNNQIGLPISMLNANADASFWIMEAGISEAHDMDELGGILHPDIGLILNVGDAHVAGLGPNGVAANKALLLDYIQPAGVAIVSADYPDLNAEIEKRLPVLERRAIQLVRFSASDGQAVFRAKYLGPGYDLTGKYEVAMPGGSIIVEAPFRGDYGSENVAAICAAAHTLRIGHEEIIRGLACATLPEQRFAGSRVGKFIVLDDSYNANPLSMGRMVDSARLLAEENGLPLILVLGEMLELGDKAEDAHEALGRQAAQAALSFFFWKGGMRYSVKRGLDAAGFTGDFYPVGGGQDFSLLLEELSLAAGVVLFKGSRSNHLERLVDVFREHITTAEDDHAL